ncbi:MAG: 2-hydroxy-6-ketonona-2,4-dienedioic acid hydrolase [Acidimicrobiales bacterium]|nr:MAG: 2-hydroxy-6-ketonona-2,4-dienedioic acid hydrolase [Acidimicrobiales bacterium]
MAVLPLAEAEQQYFDSLGIEPFERFVDLANVGARVRVLEIGTGSPVVFVHGGMVAGASWAGLAASLPDHRCILLDRPGCGGSDMPAGAFATIEEKERVADELLADLLDGLDLPSASVVSTSLGGWYSFRSAAAHPDRIDRIVAMGFQVGASIQAAPLIMRVPAPRWIPRFRPPVGRRMARSMLRQSGMKSAIDSGKFNEMMLTWMVSLLRTTDTMPNEMTTAPRPIGLRGPNAATMHSPELLARVTAPTHLFWGDDDLFGGETVAREFAAALPDASVEMVPGAGHAPWIDAPVAAADAVRRHLAGPSPSH